MKSEKFKLELEKLLARLLFDSLTVLHIRELLIFLSFSVLGISIAKIQALYLSFDSDPTSTGRT